MNPLYVLLTTIKAPFVKRAEPIGTRARACLDPDELVKRVVVPTVAQPIFVLACFQLGLHLSEGLM